MNTDNDLHGSTAWKDEDIGQSVMNNHLKEESEEENDDKPEWISISKQQTR
jgi:hypothetical protein